MYALFDARACGGEGADDSSILCTAETLKEIRRDAKDMAVCEAIYEFTDNDVDWIEDYTPKEGK